MVYQHAAFIEPNRPIWAFEGIRSRYNDYGEEELPDMLKIVDFKISVPSDAAARRLKLPQGVNRIRVRTEMRQAWLRIDRTTGAGWVRADHIYSPVVYNHNWQRWVRDHRGESGYAFTRVSIWTRLPEFMATYPRFQRKPSIEVQDAVPTTISLGPFSTAEWWDGVRDEDYPRGTPGMSEQAEAALLGDSSAFDKRIWFKRVQQGNPERVLNSQAAYDGWWRFFGDV